MISCVKIEMCKETSVYKQNAKGNIQRPGLTELKNKTIFHPKYYQPLKNSQGDMRHETKDQI